MVAGAGRNLELQDSSLAKIAGIRTKGVSIAAEPIDITTDDETGIRTFLDTNGDGTGELDPAARQIDISFDGITKDDALKAAIATGTGMLATYTVVYPSGAKISGKFALVSIEETGAYQDAVTFSGELQSTGSWTYTAAP